MGYMSHRAIIVTGMKESVVLAHRYAKKLFNAPIDEDYGQLLLVTDIISITVNGYCSFMIAPDGSKRGWTPSAICDERRSKYITWLTKRQFVHWVYIQFADDYDINKILDCS